MHIHTWPTRVLMSVFLSLLSLCSVTLICCLMISADVRGRLGLTTTCVDPDPLPFGGIGDPENDPNPILF